MLGSLPRTRSLPWLPLTHRKRALTGMSTLARTKRPERIRPAFRSVGGGGCGGGGVDGVMGGRSGSHDGQRDRDGLHFWTCDRKQPEVCIIRELPWKNELTNELLDPPSFKPVPLPLQMRDDHHDGGSD